MSEQWYFSRGERQVGPFGASQVKEMVTAGHLRPTDLARRNETDEWRPASAIKELFPDKDPISTTPSTSNGQAVATSGSDVVPQKEKSIGVNQAPKNDVIADLTSTVKTGFASFMQQLSPKPERWYFSRDDRQIGPYTTAQAKEMAASGQLLPTDFVRNETTTSWLVAGSAKWLYPDVPVVPTFSSSSAGILAEPRVNGSPGAAGINADAASNTSGPPPLHNETTDKGSPSAVEKAEWHYSSCGNQCGPVTVASLHALASTGKLLPTDMVWKPGMANWATAEAVGIQFPDTSHIPPPLPPKLPSTGVTNRVTGELHIPACDVAADEWTVLLDGEKIATLLPSVGLHNLTFETEVGHHSITIAYEDKLLSPVGKMIGNALGNALKTRTQAYPASFDKSGHYTITFPPRTFWSSPFLPKPEITYSSVALEVIAASEERKKALVGLWHNVNVPGKSLGFTKDGAMFRDDGFARKFRWLGKETIELYEDGSDIKVQYLILSLGPKELILKVDEETSLFRKESTTPTLTTPKTTKVDPGGGKQSAPTALVGKPGMTTSTNTDSVGNPIPETSNKPRPLPSALASTPASITTTQQQQPEPIPAEVTETDPKAIYDKAKELLNDGKYRDAIAHCNALLATRPGNKKALALRGKAHLGATEYQKAIADLKKVEGESDSADRNLWLAYRAVGIECLRDANYRQAIVYFDAAPNIPENDVELRYLRGLANLEFGVSEWETTGNTTKWIDADENFTYALGNDPTCAPAYVGRGRTALLKAAYYRTNGPKASSEYKQAVSDFAEAITLDREFGDAYFYRGEAYTLWANNGGTADMAALASQDYEWARNLSPQWAEVVDHREWVLAEAERVERLNAEERRQQIERDKDLPVVYYNCDWCGATLTAVNDVPAQSKCPTCRKTILASEALRARSTPDGRPPNATGGFFARLFEGNSYLGSNNGVSYREELEAKLKRQIFYQDFYYRDDPQRALLHQQQAADIRAELNRHFP